MVVLGVSAIEFDLNVLGFWLVDVILVSVTSVVDARCTDGRALSSRLSGLEDRLAVKPFSKGFSPDMSAGPVTGPSAPNPCAPVPS